jgi:hypothetical protein
VDWSLTRAPQAGTEDLTVLVRNPSALRAASTANTL